MCVQGQIQHQCIDEAGGGGVERNGAVSIPELDVAQSEFCGTPVQIGFCIFAQSQAEIQTNLHQVR